jgi:hypothetical protein
MHNSDAMRGEIIAPAVRPLGGNLGKQLSDLLAVASPDPLTAADEGKLTQAFNNGLATEAAQYAKRAARALCDDPVPYALAASVLAVLTACGLRGIRSFLPSVAIQMKKK